jgi:hypothetical protein
MAAVQGSEREAFRDPGRDVEHESWLTPCRVLGAVDPELTAADPANEHVDELIEAARRLGSALESIQGVVIRRNGVA